MNRTDGPAPAPPGGMTPKERMIAALTGSRPDCLPSAPAYLSLFLADFERTNYVDQYRLRLRGAPGGSRHPVDHDEDTLFRARAIYDSYQIFKERPDWIEIHIGITRAWAARTNILVQDGALYYEDSETGVRLPMDRVPMPRGDDRLVTDDASHSDVWDASSDIGGPDDIDARLPIVTSDERLARGHFDLVRRMVADYGDRYFISTILDTPFSDAYDLLGFQGLMLIQHDRPRLLEHLLERKLAQTQEVMAAFAACGVHGVYVEEVFTGADLISPRSYDRFVFAYNRPYFHHMRSLGLLPIHYVCGDTIPRLERMVQYDVAAVAVEESKKAFRIEIEDVVERVAGRCAVLGNIDAVRFGLNAPLDDMAAEVRRQAAIGARAAGFIVSTGSPFPLDTNPRLIDTMNSTAHSIGG